MTLIVPTSPLQLESVPPRGRPERPDPLQVRFDIAGIRQRSVRGAGVTAIAQALKFVLQFGSQIMLARLLDPAQFGLVAMVGPVLGLALALNDFGLVQAIVQRQTITSRQVTGVFWVSIGIGTALTALAMCVAPLIALMYDEPRVLAITLASAGLIWLTSASVIPMALLNRQMRFEVLSAIEVGAMVVGLASGIGAALAGAGYWSIVFMQAVNAAITLVAAWVLCGWRPGWPRREPGVGSMMRFGTNLMASNVASYLSSSADNLIVGLTSGTVALGLYERSYNLVVKPLWQLMAPVSRVAVPLLSRLHDDATRYATAYLLMLQAMTAACVPGLLTAIVVADALVATLFGPKWSAMAPIFSWICFGGIAAAVSSSTSWLFVTQDRTGEQMRVNIVCAVISVASFALGSVRGPIGVAAVSAVSFMLLQTPLMVWAATRRGPVGRRALARGLAPLAGAVAFAAVAVFGWWRFVPIQHGPLAILLAFVVSYAAFAAGLLAQPAGRRLVSGMRDLLSWRREAATG